MYMTHVCFYVCGNVCCVGVCGNVCCVAAYSAPVFFLSQGYIAASFGYK